VRIFRLLLCGLAVLSLSGIAAANNDGDDGFIWIDANTRIKMKPVSTTAGVGATAPEKAAPKNDAKKDKKKEKPAK
jgi:hypothetical protein